MRAHVVQQCRGDRRSWPGALLALGGIVASWAAPSASAAAPAPKQFLSVINGPQEVPPVVSSAQGLGHLTFDESTKLLCFSISYQGLGSAEILAHIHGPALPGVPAGVVFPLPPGAAKSGCVGPLDKDQKKALLKNELYVNIHSAGFPAGEIRGQILRIK